MNTPCSTKITCPCLDSNPLAGFSAEPADQKYFVGRGFTGVQPPLGVLAGQTQCETLAQSTVSQNAADLLATSDGVQCVVSTFSAGTTYPSTQQTGTALCPDGLTFTYTVPAGAFNSATSQLDANTQAQTYAASQATARRICLSSLPSGQQCSGAAYSQSITASGAFLAVSPFTDTWAVSSGSLPPGLALNETSFAGGTVYIIGNATTPGGYNFSITVTDPDGDSMTKAYSIVISGITNGTSLLAPTKNAFYSQTLLTAGLTTPIFSLASGALPAGLNLSSAGVISGTPTTVGAATFSVTATDTATSFACTTPITLTVSGTCAYPSQQLAPIPALPTASYTKLAYKPGGGGSLLGLDTGNPKHYVLYTIGATNWGAPIQNIDQGVSVGGCYCLVANGANADSFCVLATDGNQDMVLLNTSTLAIITSDEWPPNYTNNGFCMDVQFNPNNNLVYVNGYTCLFVLDPSQSGVATRVASVNNTLFGKVNFDLPHNHLIVGGLDANAPHNASILYWNIAAATPVYLTALNLPAGGGATAGGTVIYCPDNNTLYVSYQKTGTGAGYFIGIFNNTTGALISETAISDTFNYNYSQNGYYSQNGCYDPDSKLVYMCWDNSVQIICTTNNAILTPLAGVKAKDVVYVAQNKQAYLLDTSGAVSALKAYS